MTTNFADPGGRGSVAASLLGLPFRISPGAWRFVSCDCRLLSGRGLWDEPIARPEEFYRMRCVVVCDLETSRMRRQWPIRCWLLRHGKKWLEIIFLVFHYNFTRRQYSVVLLKTICVFVAQQPNSSLGRLILRFLDHTQLDTHAHAHTHTSGRTPPNEITKFSSPWKF